MSWCRRLIPAIVLSLLGTPALAQQQFIYPDRGQSQAQQDQDKYLTRP
ncbi:MAG TPA: hypothetical protein VFA23_13320 [Dongiaceae bacterium]|jgi:hypothetical protein|nr:hypothetical protein [Dongiaceae bacterium]